MDLFARDPLHIMQEIPDLCPVGYATEQHTQEGFSLKSEAHEGAMSVFLFRDPTDLDPWG
jgi:hypothetical protein